MRARIPVALALVTALFACEDNQGSLAPDAASAVKAPAAANASEASQIAQLRQNQAWLNQVNAGIQALNGNKLDSAAYYARRAMLANPNSPYGHYILGTVAVQQKQYDAAQQQYLTILDKNANSANAHFLLGEIALAQGNKDAARVEWRKAFKIDPLHFNANQRLFN